MLTILSSQKWLRSKGIDVSNIVQKSVNRWIDWLDELTSFTNYMNYMNPKYKSRNHPTWEKWKFKHMSKSQTSHEYEMKFVFVYLNE